MDKVTAASSICFTWVIQKCDVENVQAISTRTFQCLCAKALNRQHLPSASARHGNTPLTCRVTTEYDGRGATDWNDGPVVAPMGTCTAVQLEKVSSGSRHCPWLRPTWILPEIIQNHPKFQMLTETPSKVMPWSRLLSSSECLMAMWLPNRVHTNTDSHNGRIMIYQDISGCSRYAGNPNGSFNCKGGLVSF